VPSPSSPTLLLPQVHTEVTAEMPVTWVRPATLTGTGLSAVLPLLSWDDEQVPRESGLALFDAFASREKSLHANPGRHGGMPMSEVENSLRFLGRHLSPGSGG
jgi:hypothetical protein